MSFLSRGSASGSDLTPISTPIPGWDVILPIDEVHHFSRWWNCTTKQTIINHITHIHSYPNIPSGKRLQKTNWKDPPCYFHHDWQNWSSAQDVLFSHNYGKSAAIHPDWQNWSSAQDVQLNIKSERAQEMQNIYESLHDFTSEDPGWFGETGGQGGQAGTVKRWLFSWLTFE